MPPEARLFIVEDDKKSREYLTLLLERYGHHVIKSAASLPEALEIIPTLPEEGINVSILDSNLGSSRNKDGSDGQTLLEAMKQYAPDIPTVGYSSSRFPGVTVDVGKGSSVKELAEIINQI